MRTASSQGETPTALSKRSGWRPAEGRWRLPAAPRPHTSRRRPGHCPSRRAASHGPARARARAHGLGRREAALAPGSSQKPPRGRARLTSSRAAAMSLAAPPPAAAAPTTPLEPSGLPPRPRTAPRKWRHAVATGRARREPRLFHGVSGAEQLVRPPPRPSPALPWRRAPPPAAAWPGRGAGPRAFPPPRGPEGRGARPGGR